MASRSSHIPTPQLSGPETFLYIKEICESLLEMAHKLGQARLADLLAAAAVEADQAARDVEEL